MAVENEVDVCWINFSTFDPSIKVGGFDAHAAHKMTAMRADHEGF